MITVGMLSHRKDPKTVYKSYAYAAVAKMEGVNFYFFSPGRVNFEKESIYGWIYENGQWIEKNMPFPDVIYNSSSPQTEKQEKIVDQLSELIPFTSHSIGSKWYVYQKVKKGKTFESYLIPSVHVTKPEEVFEFLALYGDIVIKPLNGHKGKQIMFVRKNEELFALQEGQKTKVIDKEELKNTIDHLIKTDDFLAQAFIESKTKNGKSMHLRLHVQKDGEGEWGLTTTFPCIAMEGFISNLSSGGYTVMCDDFLRQEFGEEHYNIKRYLEQFAIHFTKHFDGLYNGQLDELGIDVGLDRNQKIWILEVNWRPGTPPTFSFELDVAKNMIRYACYLAGRN